MRNTAALKWNKTQTPTCYQVWSFREEEKTGLSLDILKAEQMQEKEQWSSAQGCRPPLFVTQLLSRAKRRRLKLHP